MMKTVFFPLLLLFLSSQLTGQIVDIESKRNKLDDTTGLFGAVDIAFSLVSNTKKIISARGALRLEWINKRHHVLSLTDYNLVSVDDDRFINNAFQHFRYNYQINEWLSWEAFGQVQENEQIRIKLRGLSGTGPRFRIYKKGTQKVYLGTLYMYEYNEISDTNFIQRDHRLSAYLSLVLAPNDFLSISSTSYVQPEIVDPADIRLNSATTLRIKVTNRLSFQTSLNISYDSQLSKEAEGVPSTNYRVLNGLRWNF